MYPHNHSNRYQHQSLELSTFPPHHTLYQILCRRSTTKPRDHNLFLEWSTFQVDPTTMWPDLISNSTRAIHRPADLTRIATIDLVWLPAFVCQTTEELHQTVGRNASSTRIVHTTWLASMKSVAILAQDLVPTMPYAECTNTSRIASVKTVTPEIRMFPVNPHP